MVRQLRRHGWWALLCALFFFAAANPDPWALVLFLYVVLLIGYGIFRLIKRVVRRANRGAASQRSTMMASPRRIVRSSAKRLFMDDYGIEPPAGVSVLETDEARPFLDLRRPEWAAAKADGTANQRARDNQLLKPVSRFVFGGYVCESEDVVALYWLAVEMRRAGFPVPLSDEEKDAHETAVYWSDPSMLKRSTPLSIHRRFSPDPREFELFCGNLMRAEGYDVEVTPYRKDGGIDLRMHRNGERWIVECKCLDPKGANVGRPVLQKLVGANGAEGGSKKMMVMTTTGFSREALAYAETMDIELLDGKAIVELWRKRPATRLPMGRTWLDPQGLVPSDALGAYGSSMQRLVDQASVSDEELRAIEDARIDAALTRRRLMSEQAKAIPRPLSRSDSASGRVW